MKTLTQTTLTPAQQRAYEGLMAGLPVGNVLVLRGSDGSGKTAILQNVQSVAGGVLIGARDFMNALSAKHPEAIEEAFLTMIEQALAHHDLVIVDDLHLVTRIVNSCDYPRAFLLDAALTAVLAEAGIQKKKLIFAVTGEPPWPLAHRAYTSTIGEFTPEDYQQICAAVLSGDQASALDCARIHRFAPGLSALQLVNVSRWLSRQPELTTDAFLDYLREQEMGSNVDSQEVERVDWSDLKGVDQVVKELEVKIALPFENDALSAEWKLKPKRGVLLAGPPGTGKTTIGRALAHRLKSKFFLIDGTTIAGTGDFYGKVSRVFESAKKNAPAVVFIDDADVIFEGDYSPGFHRYLLTMLDGLESASAERVCVILTAMHAGGLPQSVLRSGRVELWLETALPDAPAREAILRARLEPLPAPLGTADAARLAEASQGLSGADLKNVVEDGKLLFAHEQCGGKPSKPVEDYFLEAIGSIYANRRKYARSKPPRFVGAVKVGFNA